MYSFLWILKFEKQKNLYLQIYISSFLLALTSHAKTQKRLPLVHPTEFYNSCASHKHAFWSSFFFLKKRPDLYLVNFYILMKPWQFWDFAIWLHFGILANYFDHTLWNFIILWLRCFCHFALNFCFQMNEEWILWSTEWMI